LSDTEHNQITLALNVSEEDRALAVRYLLTPRSLTPEERIRALEVFDGLGASTLAVGGRTETFVRFYRAQIEDKHADMFLDQLLNADNPEAVGGQLLQETWQRVVSNLQSIGVQLAGDIGQQCLVAFCGYWWQSFGKGYIREVAVFRDLERSGIRFAAHDLRQRQERFSPHDLTVLGFRGDVKTSTYFLHVARSYPLANDFYLVRIYDPARRRWLGIALMKPAVWQRIDGDITPCELDQVTQLLPTPLQLVTRDEPLIVITYEDWKQRVLRAQAQAKEES
jgi:hypothetical protein